MTFAFLAICLFFILFLSCICFGFIALEIYSFLEDYEKKLKGLETSYKLTLELNKNIIETNSFILKNSQKMAIQNQELLKLNEK